MKFIISILFTAAVVMVLGHALPGIVVTNFWTAVVVALVLALLNAVLKPILVVLTFPITVFTFGLFLFVINVFLIYICDKFIGGFEVDSFWWALIFSILVSMATSWFQKEVLRIKEKE
ncbi:MAG TPA: phage holin family protein [Chitinophagaceae bacterium]|nr:phage holin family protein [Chitinophagaceae bacterium]